jgi:hypothetical protein
MSKHRWRCETEALATQRIYKIADMRQRFLNRYGIHDVREGDNVLWIRVCRHAVLSKEKRREIKHYAKPFGVTFGKILPKPTV